MSTPIAPDQAYFNKISKIFDHTCSEFENDIYAVGWISPETQRRRFEVLLDGIPKDEPFHLLDVGCGQGELLAYLQDQKIDCIYTGIDISPVMIAWSRSRFPGHEFLLKNILEVDTTYDYVVASGIFCHRHDDSLGIAQTLMAAMVKNARLGVAFNALSTTSPAHLVDTKNFQYFDPKDLFAAAQKLTPFVNLRQDYLPNDLTLYLYKSLS